MCCRPNYLNIQERQWKDVLESWCIDNASFSFVYYISLDAILVWFPLIVMTILFIFIFIIVYSMVMRIFLIG